MSVLNRAARVATLILCAAGLAASSTPGLAYETPLPVPTPAVMATAPTTLQPPVDQNATEATLAPAVETTPVPTFATLDAAVAAQDLTAGSNEALTCLAGAIYFESKGEPLAGQLAVAKVIMNRAKSGRFASDICGVVTQRGQFSFVRGGRVPAIGDNAQYRTARAVAKVALADAWESPAPSALFFNTPGNPPGARLTRVAMIGHHIFYR